MIKVFGGYMEGRTRFIIAAKSQKEAAILIGSSLGAFRNFASETGNDEEIRIAMEKPGVVFARLDSVETKFTAAKEGQADG